MTSTTGSNLGWYSYATGELGELSVGLPGQGEIEAFEIQIQGF
jgi:hypothetical protein